MLVMPNKKMGHMNISYQVIVSWLKTNIKLLLLLEILFFLMAGLYFMQAPRIYEATFSIGLPKVAASPLPGITLTKMQLMISPQEFIRPTQDPLGYSGEFIKNCMGQDTNANRKEFINGLQLGVKQQGDVIAFTLRLKGSERVAQCANLLLGKVLADLVISQDKYLQTANISLSNVGGFVRPAEVQPVRISDSYIKPQLNRLLFMALVLAIIMTIFISLLKQKYRA